ncbi:GvpL/GvpF family gas vesicle protein [Burkholderia humptydooensis]|uniref:GvpL/GvpF family gas vesicle protein n=2 Tax=Burkholderia humptydooensis TaxID=430531 RepID=A0A7U4P925_9BURK|nr:MULTISPECIES: GvpL/GvpF family gas vesicle protein [Burkholderia]AJY40619.1 gas vesicle synthesis GvpL/GvpF family protein [Burkholderia sp. 2002721687]ALX45225.1 gas vesicle protein GvpFL [Burkholderia humptydooensis]EIP85672.1 Gas vesicle synthesis GvpLGvpF [Burkholderia humptydooensis MSMB43]QPS46692.1 GvpL/GvpF family gas vesicle protein [Burkholderia humptydooensis]
MVWLTYAVLTPKRSITLPPGVAGARLEIVDGAHLRTIVSEHPRAPSATIPSALDFGQTVAALFRHGAIVPMRFPTCLDSKQAVRDWLDDESDMYRDLLQRIDGCVEMGLRFRLPEAPRAQPRPQAGGPGHAYLAARGAPNSVARSHGERIAAVLRNLYRDWRFDGLVEGFVSLSFLVRQTTLDDFVDRCRQAARETAFPLYMSGPWPPYSFATDERSSAPEPHRALRLMRRPSTAVSISANVAAPEKKDSAR